MKNLRNIIQEFYTHKLLIFQRHNNNIQKEKR